MLNSGFWTQITNFYVSQTSTVVLCMQYSVISTRITFLYGSQPLFVIFACKTAWFAPEWQASMGTWHDLTWPDVLCTYNGVLSIRITSLYGYPPLSVDFDRKTASFVQNYKSLCVPNLTYTFVHAKHREWHLNYKSLWVPDLTYRFVYAKQGV